MSAYGSDSELNTKLNLVGGPSEGESVYSVNEETQMVYEEDDIIPCLSDSQNTRIINEIIAKRGVFSMKGMTILYIPSLGAWSHLASVVSMKHIATVIGAENATVNYGACCLERLLEDVVGNVL